MPNSHKYVPGVLNEPPHSCGFQWEKGAQECGKPALVMCVTDHLWLCPEDRPRHHHGKIDAGGTLEARPAPHGRLGQVSRIVG